MTNFSEHLQQADWKKEKHVPVVGCPDSRIGLEICCLFILTLHD